MKRFLSKVLTVAMATTLLAGCSSKTPATGGSKDKVTISVMAWNDAADALSACIPAFEAANSNIKVNVIKTGDSATKITAAFAAGSGAPDMCQFQQQDIANYYKKFQKSFVNLEPYFAKESGLKDQFASWVWPAISIDGKAYSFPWDIGPAGMYYRTDIFKNAGVDVNTIKTYDDYIEAGKTIVAKTGGKTKMIGLNYTGISNFDLLVRQQGGQIFTDSGDINLNSTEAKNVLEIEKKMKDAGITIDDRGDWNQGITNLNNNSIATVLYPVWYAGTMMNSAKDLSGKWAVTTLPAFAPGGPTASNAGGSVLAITSQSKHPDEAFKFIKYCFATNEGNDIQCKFGLYPSWTPYYTTANFTKKWDYFGGQSIYSFFGEVSKNVKSFNFTDDFNQWGTPLNSEGTKFLAGKEDAATALSNTAKALSTLTKRKVAP